MIRLLRFKGVQHGSNNSQAELSLLSESSMEAQRRFFAEKRRQRKLKKKGTTTNPTGIELDLEDTPIVRNNNNSPRRRRRRSSSSNSIGSTSSSSVHSINDYGPPRKCRNTPRAAQELSAARAGSTKRLAKDILQSRSLTDMEVAFCTTPESNNNDCGDDNVSLVSDLDDNFSNTSGSHYYKGGNDYGVCRRRRCSNKGSAAVVDDKDRPNDAAMMLDHSTSVIQRRLEIEARLKELILTNNKDHTDEAKNVAVPGRKKAAPSSLVTQLIEKFDGKNANNRDALHETSNAVKVAENEEYKLPVVAIVSPDDDEDMNKRWRDTDPPGLDYSAVECYSYQGSPQRAVEKDGDANNEMISSALTETGPLLSTPPTGQHSENITQSVLEMEETVDVSKEDVHHKSIVDVARTDQLLHDAPIVSPTESENGRSMHQDLSAEEGCLIHPEEPSTFLPCIDFAEDKSQQQDGKNLVDRIDMDEIIPLQRSQQRSITHTAQSHEALSENQECLGGGSNVIPHGSNDSPKSKDANWEGSSEDIHVEASNSECRPTDYVAPTSRNNALLETGQWCQGANVETSCEEDEDGMQSSLPYLQKSPSIQFLRSKDRQLMARDNDSMKANQGTDSDSQSMERRGDLTPTSEQETFDSSSEALSENQECLGGGSNVVPHGGNDSSKLRDADWEGSSEDIHIEARKSKCRPTDYVAPTSRNNAVLQTGQWCQVANVETSFEEDEDGMQSPLPYLQKSPSIHFLRSKDRQLMARDNDSMKTDQGTDSVSQSTKRRGDLTPTSEQETFGRSEALSDNQECLDDGSYVVTHSSNDSQKSSDENWEGSSEDIHIEARKSKCRPTDYVAPTDRNNALLQTGQWCQGATEETSFEEDEDGMQSSLPYLQKSPSTQFLRSKERLLTARDNDSMIANQSTDSDSQSTERRGDLTPTSEQGTFGSSEADKTLSVEVRKPAKVSDEARESLLLADKVAARVKDVLNKYRSEDFSETNYPDDEPPRIISPEACSTTGQVDR